MVLAHCQEAGLPVSRLRSLWVPWWPLLASRWAVIDGLLGGRVHLFGRDEDGGPGPSCPASADSQRGGGTEVVRHIHYAVYIITAKGEIEGLQVAAQTLLDKLLKMGFA